MNREPTNQELVAQARIVQLPEPRERPPVKRVGLGYVGTFPGGVTLRVTHLREARDEFKGELTVTCNGVGTVDDQLFWGTFNMMSGTTRNSLAKLLAEKATADWKQFLELFCLEVARMEREGAPVQYTEPEGGGPKPVEYLLDPILPRGLPTTIYGRGGIGKSTLAAAIAVSVEYGYELLRGWKPAQAKTLLLDWEADIQPWQARCNAFIRGRELPPRRMAYRAMRRHLAEDVEYLSTLCAREEIGLVVVDSVLPAFGVGHEGADKSDPVIRAYEAMRQVGEDVTWLLIDHVNAGDAKAGDADKAYGSIYKDNLARQAFLLMGDREDAGDSLELVLKHKKSNYSRLIPEQGIVITRLDDQHMTIEMTDNIESATLQESFSVPTRLKNLLRDGAKSPEYLREALHVSASHWRVTVKRALDTGGVIRLPDGKLGLGDRGRNADE